MIWFWLLAGSKNFRINIQQNKKTKSQWLWALIITVMSFMHCCCCDCCNCCSLLRWAILNVKAMSFCHFVMQILLSLAVSIYPSHSYTFILSFLPFCRAENFNLIFIVFTFIIIILIGDRSKNASHKYY